MTYEFNPSPAESALLWMIRQHESSQNYEAQNPGSTSSGAYGDIDETWLDLCHLCGVDHTQYPHARTAPPAVQDACNLLLLRLYGPNHMYSWSASGPYPSFQEVKGMLMAAGIAAP